MKPLDPATTYVRGVLVTGPASSEAELGLERAVLEALLDRDEEPRGVGAVDGMTFQGPAELIPRYHAGERVMITTTAPSGMHIASIRPAPLS